MPLLLGSFNFLTSNIPKRGIDVLVEIDTPGHTAIIAEAYPAFIACSEATPWGTYAAEPPAGQLRIASVAATNFTATLLSSVARLLPSKYFSTGGDEVNTKCYQEDKSTQTALKQLGWTIEHALNVFTQATHSALVSEGKTPVVWEGSLFELLLSQTLCSKNSLKKWSWITT